MGKSVTLGDEGLVRRLYSYPNNFNEVGFLSQTLEQTIETWFRSTVKRDGFGLVATAQVGGGQVQMQLAGDGEDQYDAVLPAYLQAGATALNASVSLNTANKWLYNWRFILPHGLAMVRHRSVQLLHFPPDYVLERDQDYLKAHTTTRWAELLVENGANASSTDQYQTIVDIAPVAAPSDAGVQLEGIYTSYSDYINALLDLWLPMPDGTVRPMVAFGAPVKQWLKTVYGLDLAVLQQKQLTLKSGIVVQVLGSNHPSFIYNAAKQQPDEAPQTPEQLLQRAMRIMQQDLVAARWQVAMAANPAGDPAKELADANAFWSDPAKHGRICQLTYTQAFNKSGADAQKLCASLPQPMLLATEQEHVPLNVLDAEIEVLRRRLGALDGREPDQIPQV
jgi:hypothetical protein